MSTVVATSLIEKLKEIQAKEGLNDYKFADNLGISPQLWQMTRTGKRDIGLVILRAATKAYPELYRDVLFFLGDDVKMFNGISQNFTTPSEPSQKRFLGGLGDKAIHFLRSLFSRS